MAYMAGAPPRRVLLVAAVLCAAAPPGFGYVLEDGKCVKEPGDSPPRRVAGLVAPNLTDVDGKSTAGVGVPGINGGCGCDPELPADFNASYQVNRRCPLNAEALLGLLGPPGASPTTPENRFLKRNHGAFPVLEEPSEFMVEFSGVGLTPPTRIILLDQIKDDFTAHTVTAVICCAGNRRTEVDLAECPAPPKEVIESPLVNVTADGRRVKTVDGVSWGAGSLANGVHTGALLADILRFLLGDVIDTLPSSTYVELEGADIVPEETFLKSTLGYAAGLPLSYVMDPANQVLLAYELNGEALTPAHGAPLRVVCPGLIGARSVKWVVKVTLLDQPSSAYFMQQDYKHFSPNLLPSFEQCLINSSVTTADESGRAFEGAFEAAVRPLPSGSRTTVAPRPAQAAAPEVVAARTGATGATARRPVEASRSNAKSASSAATPRPAAPESRHKNRRSKSCRGESKRCNTRNKLCCYGLECDTEQPRWWKRVCIPKRCRVESKRCNNENKICCDGLECDIEQPRWRDRVCISSHPVPDDDELTYCQLPDEVYADAVPFTTLNVNLAITKPASATTNIVGKDGPLGITAGEPLEVEGFAFSGGGNAVQAVYVCLLPEGEPLSWCDEWQGITPGWTGATLDPPAVPIALPTESPSNSNWAWTFWSATIAPEGGVVRAGAYRVVARAVDTGNQNMPENICPIYSWRGVMNNAWFKLPVIAGK